MFLMYAVIAVFNSLSVVGEHDTPQLKCTATFRTHCTIRQEFMMIFTQGIEFPFLQNQAVHELQKQFTQ